MKKLKVTENVNKANQKEFDDLSVGEAFHYVNNSNHTYIKLNGIDGWNALSLSFGRVVSVESTTAVVVATSAHLTINW